MEQVATAIASIEALREELLDKDVNFFRPAQPLPFLIAEPLVESAFFQTLSGQQDAEESDNQEPLAMTLTKK